jgi:hypothetical protein
MPEMLGAGTCTTIIALYSGTQALRSLGYLSVALRINLFDSFDYFSTFPKGKSI